MKSRQFWKHLSTLQTNSLENFLCMYLLEKYQTFIIKYFHVRLFYVAQYEDRILIFIIYNIFSTVIFSLTMHKDFLTVHKNIFKIDKYRLIY